MWSETKRVSVAVDWRTSIRRNARLGVGRGAGNRYMRVDGICRRMTRVSDGRRRDIRYGDTPQYCASTESSRYPFTVRLSDDEAVVVDAVCISRGHPTARHAQVCQRTIVRPEDGGEVERTERH